MARLPSSCPQLVSIAHGAPAHGRSGLRVTVLASHVCLRRCELGGRGCTRCHSRHSTLLDWRGYTLRTCYGCMMESAIMPDSTCGLTLTENT